MKASNTIPILRIFSYEKAIEFYINWLGFNIDWEHRFNDTAPRYIQISLESIILHLSEHHGDGTPGTQVRINCTGLKEYQQVLIGKNYNYGRPGLEKTFYEAWSVTVHDPFGNQLIFDEHIKKA